MIALKKGCCPKAFEKAPNMQRFFKLHWNALEIVIVLAHSLAQTYMCMYIRTSAAVAAAAAVAVADATHTHIPTCTDGANKKCILTLCMSLPHPRTLPRTHTNTIQRPETSIHIERGTLTLEFGFVSVRSRRLRLRLAGLFARFCFCGPHQQHQHHHRFISFART